MNEQSIPQGPAAWPKVRLGRFTRVASGDGLAIERIWRDSSSANRIPVIGGNGRMGFTSKSNVDDSVIAIGRVGALCGNVHRVDAPAWISDNALRLDALCDFDIDFLAWLLQAMNLNALSRSTAQPLVTGRQIAALQVPHPPMDKQRAISVFLNRETARIDTLIAEQQRLIEMLRGRRTDLIRGAVLGRVNPLDPPAGTHMAAIGHHFSVTLGKMLDAGRSLREDDEDLPYIRAGNLQDSGLRLLEVNMMPYSAREAAELNLLSGDLVVAEGGAVGTNVVLSEDMPGWSFQKTVNRLRPVDGWSSKWLGYVLRTYRDIGVVDIVCNKSTIAHLTAEKLRALRVPDCEPVEQQRIAAYLDKQTARIDTLITETARFIELSRERHSALITAAVTGQIDVRDEVA